ncbi:MAG TPA: MYXO-CTERM sorting domain-containing protein, partial [Polyangiaceae bacterium]
AGVSGAEPASSGNSAGCGCGIAGRPVPSRAWFALSLLGVALLRPIARRRAQISRRMARLN